MTNGIQNGIAKAVPSAVREWGVYSLIVVFMVGAGWMVKESSTQQHELIQSVCDAGVRRIIDAIEANTKLTETVSQRQANLLPVITELLVLQRDVIKSGLTTIQVPAATQAMPELPR